MCSIAAWFEAYCCCCCPFEAILCATSEVLRTGGVEARPRGCLFGSPQVATPLYTRTV